MKLENQFRAISRPQSQKTVCQADGKTRRWFAEFSAPFKGDLDLRISRLNLSHATPCHQAQQQRENDGSENRHEDRVDKAAAPGKA